MVDLGLECVNVPSSFYKSWNKHLYTAETLWLTGGFRGSRLKDRDLCIATTKQVLYICKQPPECKCNFPEVPYTDFVESLKACTKRKNLQKGCRLHADILRRGLLEKDICVANSLLNMYAKCGMLVKAQELFDALPVSDVVSWNTLLTGYVQHGHGNGALICFEKMQDVGHPPDAVTFSCILTACGDTRAIEKGKEVHSEIDRHRCMKKDIVLGNALVDMYIKCDALSKAQEVFDELPVRDVVSWSVLIAGYAQEGRGFEAFDLYGQMCGEGFFPNQITYVCILKACKNVGSTERGMEIHAEILVLGMLEQNLVLGNALLDMYVKYGMLVEAQKLFTELPLRDVVSWNALIAGYAQHGWADEALDCLGQMRDEGISPDAVTFVCMLKACSSMGAVEKGEAIHIEVARQGLLEENVLLGNALVDMYSKCGMLQRAEEVFNTLLFQNLVAWNALIAGYFQHGYHNEVLNYFRQMQEEGLCPDRITFTSVLKACGSIGAVEMGRDVHLEIVRRGLLEADVVLGTAVVDMYAKCGELAKAQQVFDELPHQDVVSWSALITGYVEYGHANEALNCFSWMQSMGLLPGAFTFACILKACGSIGAAEKGKEIHAEVASQGLLEIDAVLSTALLDMYAKCGIHEKAHIVFDELFVRYPIYWNTLMAGYAQLGDVNMVFTLFGDMTRELVVPDEVAFSASLTACSHAGLLDEGQMLFEIINTFYCVKPTLEHCLCMAHLFSRSGHFGKALSVLEKMPSSDPLSYWLSILGISQKWMNVHLGRRAFEHVIQLNKEYSTAYICLGNLYAASGM